MKPGILLQEEGEAMDYDRLLNLTTDLAYSACDSILVSGTVNDDCVLLLNLN